MRRCSVFGYLACVAMPVALAGCARHAVDARTTVPRIALRGCDSLGGNFTVPFDAARAALPAGFEPAPTPGGRRAGAVFYVIAVQCRQGVVDGRRLGPSWIAYAELPATPDAAHAVAGITDYTVPVAFAARPAALARAFVAQGLGDGIAGRIDGQLPAGQAGARARVAIGTLSFTLHGPTWSAPRQGPAAGRFVLFGVRDRQARRAILGSAGPATMRLGPLELEVRGAAGLIEGARRQARGFALTGLDLSFTAASQP